MGADLTMTSDDVLDTVNAAHTLLMAVPLDECDGDDESSVINALDSLDQVVISDGTRREDPEGDTVASSIAILYETASGIDWSDVPAVSESEGQAMAERLLAALEAVHDE